MSNSGRILIPNFQARDEIAAISGGNLNACFQCSNCSGICPWRDYRVFSPRLLIRQAQLGLLELGTEEIWLCTSCGKCEIECPHNLEISKIMAAIRSHALDFGKGVPKSVINALESIFQGGNPWDRPVQERDDWTIGLDVKNINEGSEVLFFVGCTAAYDPRAQKLAKSLVKCFQNAGVDYGILGTKEKDCGNCTRLLGEVDLTEIVKSDNVEAIHKNPNINTIVTASPHTYNIMSKEYRLTGIEILHYTQYLLRLIEEGDLEFTKALDHSVTFHDPCYLGRRNEIYEEPRELLKSIPGVSIVEMERTKADSLCCGGGGGRIWQETAIGERFSVPRVEEAARIGSTVLATACYFCLTNFEDAAKVAQIQDSLKVLEVAELVAQAI